jgi:hypothetical protein
MPGDVTIWLQRWRDGDKSARQELMPHVYPHLRGVAAGYLRRESAGHTPQPTALVHELYLRLLQQRRAEWNNRAHFYTFRRQDDAPDPGRSRSRGARRETRWRSRVRAAGPRHPLGGVKRRGND